MATKEEILASANPEQRQAIVNYDKTMAVEAPPGSGNILPSKADSVRRP